MRNYGKYFKSKLIFGKYSLQCLLAKGSFGEVYLGTNVLTKKNYALKIEERKTNSLLKDECSILLNLKGPGIPSIISFGVSGKYNILVENLLGKSIAQIFKENNNKLNLKDTFMFAIQALERIEYVHSKNYLHRDIKPGNFLVGNPDSSQIYLIDFGIARKYRSSRTGKHLAYHKTNKLFGTILFLSLNVLRGIEQTRKDDLESLGLIIIYLYTGQLPWSELKFNTINQAIHVLLKVRQNISLKELCNGMPIEMQVYMKYINDLKFGENPDYDYLKTLFLIVLKKFGQKNDLHFSWIDRKTVPIKIIKKKKSKSPRDICVKLLQSNSSKKIYASNSYNNTKNNVNQLIEEKNKTDINKQNNIPNSENNQYNDINLKDIRKLNESNKNINVIGNKNKDKKENIKYIKKNNKIIKTYKVVKKLNNSNSVSSNKIKELKIPFPKKAKIKTNKNDKIINNINIYSFPINNFDNGDIKHKLNKKIKSFIPKNNTQGNSNNIKNIGDCINISNININQIPNYHSHVTIFKNYKYEKIANPKKSKFNNIKNKLYNYQRLTPLNTYKTIRKTKNENLFNTQINPIHYKPIFSNRTMQNQKKLFGLNKEKNSIQQTLRTTSNHKGRKYMPLFNQEGELIRRNINNKLKLNSKSDLNERIVLSDKSYSSTNSFSNYKLNIFYKSK